MGLFLLEVDNFLDFAFLYSTCHKFRKYNLIMLVYIYSCAIKLVLLYHTCILALMKHNVYKSWINKRGLVIFIPRIFYQIRGLVIFFSLHRCLHHRTINILAAPVCTTLPVYKIVVHHCSTAPAIFTPVHTAPPSRWKDIAPVQHRTAKLMNDIAPVQHHTAPQNFLAAPGAVRTGAAPVWFAPHPCFILY